MDRRDRKYYKARAQTINLKKITSGKENADILRALRDNDPEIDTLYINYEDEWEDVRHFMVEEGDDLGWLGFFIGQSKSLQFLYIGYLPQIYYYREQDLPQDREKVDAFLRGIKHNRSIEMLHISRDIAGLESLGYLLKNGNLKEIEFDGYTIGPENARAIAYILRHNNSLKKVNFEDISISDHSMAEIATALSAHVQLEELHMHLDNGIGNNTYVALGNALRGWSNPNLNQLTLSSNYLNGIDSDIDDEGLNALAAGMRNCHSLTRLTLESNGLINAGGSTLFQCERCHLKDLNLSFGNIDDEGAVALATGLPRLNVLETLSLCHNSIGDGGAGALADRLIHLRSLKGLYLSNNSIGDLGLQALADGISNCSNLSKLTLSRNTSISVVGLRSLSALLSSDSCSLTELYLEEIRFGDDGAVALADGLKGNKALKTLRFDCPDVTYVGWSAFSKLLCDTSSINNTYVSNHTLTSIGTRTGWRNRDTPEDVKQLLSLNKRNNRRVNVALLKILKSHSDFDAEPLCQWQLKLLPLVVSWFERVGALVNTYKIFKKSAGAIQSRKLSTVYKFIRGMPLLKLKATAVTTMQQCLLIQGREKSASFKMHLGKRGR